MPSPRTWRALEIGALSALMAWCAYRAATQSLAHDEAWTWTGFVRHGPTGIMTRYAPNNHVLHSLLMWSSSRIFGLSELALRLPALLGGLLWAGAMLAWARRLFPAGPLRLVWWSAFAANPLVMDYLFQARGYGLAIGLALTAAFVLSDASHKRGLVAGSALCGASLAALPSTAFVLVGIAAAVAVRLWRGSETRRCGHFLALILPGPLVATGLLWQPLSHSERRQFHYGAASPWESLEGLMDASLRHHDGWLQVDAAWVPRATGFALVLGIGLIVYGMVRQGAAGRTTPGLALPGHALAIAIVLLGLAHHFASLPWPRERTALDLFAFAWLASGLGLAAAVARWPWSRLAATGILTLTIALMLAQLQARQFRSHAYDATAREVFECIAADRDLERDTPVRIWAEWRLERSLSAYRDLRQAAAWLAPIDAQRPWPDGPRDYYVLTGAEAQRLAASSPIPDLGKYFREMARFELSDVRILAPR
ncbi:MAG: hypothetical protein KDB53_00955 [Planctomycetes bacterium]|nr:hypothetical protein [Planctomycetota bacterium]